MNRASEQTERQIVFRGESQVECEAFSPPECGAGDVLIRSELTLMSTGTELIALHRRFETGSVWDAWVRYPFLPGYACVGRVEAVGENVRGVQVGQLVCGRFPHASMHRVDAASVTPVPDQIGAQDACWFALAKIASMALRAAAPRDTEQALVIGCGPVGQMLIRWLHASGISQLLALDPIEMRLGLAQHGGASEVFATRIEDALPLLRRRGTLPDVVIDCTGNEAVLAHALQCAADHGRVILLGDNGNPSRQRLTGDLLFRGLTVKGAHDSLETSDWHAALIYDKFFSLYRSGRFPLAGLSTHRFAPEHCIEAYEFARKRQGEAMGIFFDWSGRR